MQNEQAETPLAMELTREGHLVVKMRGIILGELDRHQAAFLALSILNYFHGQEVSGERSAPANGANGHQMKAAK